MPKKAHVRCVRCGGAHTDAIDRGPTSTQGTRCAAAVQKGTIRGHYGSYVLDGMERGLDEKAGVADGTDPLCDGCIQALDAVGLLAPPAHHDMLGDSCDDLEPLTPEEMDLLEEALANAFGPQSA